MNLKTFDEETMKVVICKICKGLGYIRAMEGPYRCPFCLGYGRLVQESHKEDFEMSQFKWPEVCQGQLAFELRDDD